MPIERYIITLIYFNLRPIVYAYNKFIFNSVNHFI